jgi:diguanylate cyclase (GGDEF)-like protein
MESDPNFNTLLADKIFRRALQGFFLSLGSPLGWLLIQFFSGTNIAEDIVANQGMYLYMTLGTACVFTLFGVYVGSKEKQLEKLSILDPLTGLYNNRYFHNRLKEFISLGKRSGKNVSLIIFDLDHFKNINDTYGHLTGDKVLREISKSIANSCRGGEIVARVGGEEIAIILPFTPQAEAVNAAERFRQEIENTVIISDIDETIRITASAGVSSTEKYQDLHTLYSAADNAMYKAKTQGRNQVCSA